MFESVPFQGTYNFHSKHLRTFNVHDFVNNPEEADNKPSGSAVHLAQFQPRAAFDMCVNFRRERIENKSLCGSPQPATLGHCAVVLSPPG